MVWFALTIVIVRYGLWLWLLILSGAEPSSEDCNAVFVKLDARGSRHVPMWCNASKPFSDTVWSVAVGGIRAMTPAAESLRQFFVQSTQ